MISQDQDVHEKPGFVEYPITLAHPHFVASKPVPIPGSEIYDRMGHIIRQDYRGTPERLPPVTAHSADEEEYYRAQGYERAGKMDPAAWVRAHADAPSVDYRPQKYPMWRDGVLIASAQEDPGATAEDFEEDATPAVLLTPQTEPSEAANLRAQMDEMNAAMRAMAAENERLRAEKADAPESAPKRAYTRRGRQSDG